MVDQVFEIMKDCNAWDWKLACKMAQTDAGEYTINEERFLSICLEK